MNNPLINPGIGMFFWMLIAFGILTFVLIKFGWPVILRSLKEREQAITDSLAMADKTKEEMRQLQAHNEEILKQAQLERDAMFQRARQASEQIIEDARIKAQAEAEQIVKSARESIEYEKLNALHELKNEVANLSIGIAEKVIRAELSDRAKANEVIKHELDRLNF